MFPHNSKIMWKIILLFILFGTTDMHFIYGIALFQSNNNNKSSIVQCVFNYIVVGCNNGKYAHPASCWSGRKTFGA
jgi:hypothetical protein